MAKKPEKKKVVKVKKVVRVKAVRKPKAKSLPKKKSVTKKPRPAAQKKPIAKNRVAKAKKKPAPLKTTKKKAVAKKPAARKAPSVNVKSAPVPVRAPQESSKMVGQPLPPPIVSKPIEDSIGVVTHYYSHIGVAVIQLNRGTLRVGETVHIKGHTTDFQQRVESMELDYKSISEAVAGQIFGMKVSEPAREHDQVYKVNHGA